MIMKKKGVKKKANVPKCKPCKPFFDDKRLLVVAIAAFFVFAFLLAFTNVPQNATITGQATDETTSIVDLFTITNLDASVAQWSFWFMITILVFGALNFAKFPPNSFLQFLIALPVGFLATAYLAPAEIFSILQSYEALGIVLSFLLPFALLVFVSAMFVSNEKIKAMSMPKILLEVFLWLFFTIVLGFKIISGIANGKVPLGLNLPLVIMIGIFILSFLIFVFNKKFRKYMWNIGKDIRKAKAEAARTESVEQKKTERALAEATE